MFYCTADDDNNSVGVIICVANAKEALALAKQQENTNQLKHQEEIKVCMECSVKNKGMEMYVRAYA